MSYTAASVRVEIRDRAVVVLLFPVGQATEDVGYRVAKLDRPVEVSDTPVVVFLPLISDTTVEVGNSIIRVEFDCPVVVGDCPVVLTLGSISYATVDVGIGLPRNDLYRLTEVVKSAMARSYSPLPM